MGTSARRALTTLLAVVATLAASTLTTGLVTPAPARAEQRICSGYDGCAAAGYPHADYPAHAQTYWWRMELGHNCTNYAAYRMVRSGMPNTRPWSGNGDAHSWGTAMSGITDQVPRVGAVAWWDRFEGGHGRLGHVAYVEKVLSDDTIIVSQDVFQGDFSWARLSRGDGTWPSGFIHFNDERLRSLSRPRILGRARVDAPLRVSAGRWSAPVRLDYRWYAGNRAIRGATRSSYTPTAAQVRDRLRVRITARSAGYAPVVVTTAASDAVGRGALRLRGKLRGRGDVQVGRSVRLTIPKVSPRPQRTRIRWLLDGRPVRGAHGRRLHLTPRQARGELVARVTYSRHGYASRSRSVRLGEVAPGEIVLRTRYVVRGTPDVGRRLRVAGGRHTPRDARTGYLWFRDGDPIADARRATYVVQPADAGHRIGVVIGLAHRGYRTLLAGAVAGVVPGAQPSGETP